MELLLLRLLRQVEGTGTCSMIINMFFNHTFEDDVDSLS
jgi:hypothetical protein